MPAISPGSKAVSKMWTNIVPGSTVLGGIETLQTTTIPAGSMPLVNGSGFRITTWGSMVNNANQKTARIVFGGTVLGLGVLTPINIAGFWKCVAEIMRTGVNTQNYSFIGYGADNGSGAVEQIQTEVGSLAINESNAIIILNQGIAVAAGDMTGSGMRIEQLVSQ